jgi:elongation factor Ts
MSEIPAALVKQLRDRTLAPFGDCKKALIETGGDIDKAIDLLRKKNSAIQAKTGDRETAEGRIGVFVDAAKGIAGLVELRCESPPVTKSEHFIGLANDIARHVANTPAKDVEELLTQPFVDGSGKTVFDRIGEVVGIIRENMKPAKFARFEGTCGAYAHHDGSVGVVLEVEGGSNPELLRDICMHIVAKKPIALNREEVPAELVAKEREIAKEQAEEQGKGKPANIVEKIAEGKVNSWLKDIVLLEQPFVKDESKTVGDLLKAAGMKPKRFVSLRVGQL